MRREAGASHAAGVVSSGRRSSRGLHCSARSKPCRIPTSMTLRTSRSRTYSKLAQAAHVPRAPTAPSRRPLQGAALGPPPRPRPSEKRAGARGPERRQRGSSTSGSTHPSSAHTRVLVAAGLHGCTLAGPDTSPRKARSRFLLREGTEGPTPAPRRRTQRTQSRLRQELASRHEDSFASASITFAMQLRPRFPPAPPQNACGRRTVSAALSLHVAR